MSRKTTKKSSKGKDRKRRDAEDDDRV
uniref:Pilus assembly protein n=1 Tax=Heterorhabditis bacteriophora TaxID=37862 RepID=A0A1I7W7C9_HETBA